MDRVGCDLTDQRIHDIIVIVFNSLSYYTPEHFSNSLFTLEANIMNFRG